MTAGSADANARSSGESYIFIHDASAYPTGPARIEPASVGGVEDFEAAGAAGGEPEEQGGEEEEAEEGENRGRRLGGQREGAVRDRQRAERLQVVDDRDLLAAPAAGGN